MTDDDTRFVCRHCGSDDINSKEEGYAWGRLEITGTPDALEYDWPCGIGDTDYETVGFICGACLHDTERLEDLVVPEEKYTSPDELRVLLGNL